MKMKRFWWVVFSIVLSLFIYTTVSFAKEPEITGETDTNKEENSVEVEEDYCTENVLSEYAARQDVINAQGDIAIDSNHFPDANFREYISYNFDKDGNGVLSKAEIDEITEIDCWWRDITSLKGIELFPHLKKLFCTKNSLTELDVSKNTELEILHCDENKLTSLDISKNQALIEVECSLNQLSSIDISKNTLLKSLNCGINNITQIDVSKNTALESLSCYCLNLTNLDISKNIKLDFLFCPSCQLTNLDLSNNKDLRMLCCFDNPITVLDISNNSKLIYVYKNGKKYEIKDEYDDYLSFDMDTEDGTSYSLCFDRKVQIITAYPQSIKLDKTSATIYYGNTLTLVPAISPADASKKLTWTSSNPAVATVNNGTVKATSKMAGTTTITAKTVNGLAATCKVTVYADNNPSNNFADIKYGDWKYNAAIAVYDKGYMTGKGTLGDRIIFSPDTDINRSQFVVSLYSMAGKPKVTYQQKFSDVKQGDWFALPVTWASNNGIVAGNKDGSFGVNGKATREQLALMFYRYAEYNGYDVSVKASTNLDGFTDAAKVDSWALTAIKWAVERGIISGKGNATDGYRIDPLKGATRIECAAMMNKFDEVYKNVPKTGIEDIEEPIALPTEDIEDIPVPEEEIEDVVDEEDNIEDEDSIDDEDLTPGEEDIIDDEDIIPKEEIEDSEEDINP